MARHIHPPVANLGLFTLGCIRFGRWVLRHDVGCAPLGAEVSCTKIKQGMNRGMYLCDHQDS
jgi:hypothetical protein